MNNLIFAYTRQNAIDDGMIADLSELFHDEVRDAGIKIKLYATTSVYHKYIYLSQKAKEMGCDEKGRAWDLIFMSRPALKKAFHEGIAYFEFLCVTEKRKPSLCKCKILFDGEAFTICELNED